MRRLAERDVEDRCRARSHRLGFHVDKKIDIVERIFLLNVAKQKLKSAGFPNSNAR
jgi:hypothetical protein